MIWRLISMKKAISNSAGNLNSGFSYLISTVMSVQKFPFASWGGIELKNQNKFRPSTVMKLFTFHSFLGVVSSLHYTYRAGMFLEYLPKSFMVSVFLTKWGGLLYPEILPDKFKKEAVVGFGNPFLTSKLLLKEQTQAMKHT